MEALRDDNSKLGPLILNVLGILEWSYLHRLFEQEGIDKAMSQLQCYIAYITSFELQEGIDFKESCETTHKIGIVLDPIGFGVNPPYIPPITTLSLDPTTPLSHSNPLTITQEKSR